MDSSHYQIHSDRVLTSKKVVLDFLLCGLCKNLLWQAEKCVSCRSHFCKFCVSFSLLKSKKCPTCMNEYIKGPPDHFLVEDLKELFIRCVFSFNGCTKVVPYDEITQHEGECIYRERVCEECNSKILKKYYHTHIILCKNSIANNLFIDTNQIISYYQDKLIKIEKENNDDLANLKKYFSEAYVQKEENITKLVDTIHKQHKILEELVMELNNSNNSNNNNVNESIIKSGEKITCNFI
jgi:hypothetical protein